MASTINAALEVAEIATPATPTAAYGKLYPKSTDLWYTLDGNGIEYLLTPSLIRTITITQVSTTTPLANLSGFTFNARAGEWYKIEVYIIFNTAINTTGLNLGLNHTGGTVNMRVEIQSGAATYTNGTIITSGGNLLAANSNGATNSAARMDGIFNCTTAGAFNITFATEVATSAVNIQPSSYMMITRIV